MASDYLRGNSLIDEEILRHLGAAPENSAIDALSKRVNDISERLGLTAERKNALGSIPLADIANKFAVSSAAMKKMMEKSRITTMSVDWAELHPDNKQPLKAAPIKEEIKPLTKSPYGEW